MSDKDKQQRYQNISQQIVDAIGGKENIVASTHCATRLRIVLKDYDKINKEAIDNIDLVKGEFVAGNQLQIIFGAGLVNEVYEVFADYTGTAGKSMAEVKEEAAKKDEPPAGGDQVAVRCVCGHHARHSGCGAALRPDRRAQPVGCGGKQRHAVRHQQAGQSGLQRHL
ncbi:PTS transporter subunit EIIB [uncultured Gemmiger sp.]|uniref:PTS transporter subunit EIIB n=1 Tax=uncultured Gemmiger sp. TaxID=1623490 RepID=UPI0025D06CB0|nr:PTS transporter subunit EIIB [uncultured Gemmiger sp.]